MRHSQLPLLVVVTLTGAVALAAARANDKSGAVISIPVPERLDFDVEERLAPGLIVDFTQGASDRRTDSRTARMPAVFVPAGEPPTPFLESGPFTATFRGYLLLDLSSDYTLHLAGRGEAAVRINGMEILRAEGDLALADPVTVGLYSDYTPIELVYESAADGAAELRVYWERRASDGGGEDGFAPEPLPPSTLWHDPQDPQLERPLRLRRGRELFANLNCTACHSLGESPPTRDRQMAELSRKNPDVTGAGSRLKRAWLYHWIADPSAMRNEITMPRVFGANVDVAERQEIADIVAYLESLQVGLPPVEQTPAAADDGAVRAGEILYENLGCIACHRFTSPLQEDYYERISLYAAGEKFRAGRLVGFLQAPHAHYPSSRMPDFRLSDSDATQLAAFIRARSEWRPAEALDMPVGNPAKGKAVFQTRGCGACHGVPTGEQGKPTPIPLAADAESQAGCLAPAGADRGDAPLFSLTDADLRALRVFVAAGQQTVESLQRPVPAEASARLVARLRCAACHARDGNFSTLSEVILEEGTQGLPVVGVPSLTWAGEKLQRDWAGKLLRGELGYRARPWLAARMPAFPAYAEPLAHGLPREHGVSGGVRTRPDLDEQLARVGETLTQQFTGFYCTECHAGAGRPPSTAFDHRGIDFPYVTERLQYDYYHRWMRDPQRIDPGTKMPQFAKQPKPDILDGDARAQFDAIWHYLQSLERKSAPEAAMP